MKTVTTYFPHIQYIATAKKAMKTGSKKTEAKERFSIAITFSALAIEAFANEVIELLLPDLAPDLESLSPKGKINIICKELKITTNYGAEPWQHLGTLISARNQIVHAKPNGRTKLEAMLNEESATTAIKAIKIIERIEKNLPKVKAQIFKIK